VTAAPAGADGKYEGLLSALVVVARSHGLLLSTNQLVQDNQFKGDRLSVNDLWRAATRAGLKAKRVHLHAEDFTKLKKALPAIVVLRTGVAMVVSNVVVNADSTHITLVDPANEDNGELVLDSLGFQAAWNGELVIVKRDYDLKDEEQPFSYHFITALVFREKRMVRDLVISSFVLALFGLAPIIFWQVLNSRVMYYAAMNTFTVVCVGFAVIIAFEAAFGFFRLFLLNIIVARVDARINEYLYERLLRLPIDFFERTTVGEISHDMQEAYKIRDFMTGQLFGTVLDSMMLLFFLPVMIAYSPLLTAIVLAFCGLIVLWLIAMLPSIRRATGRLIAAQVDKGIHLYQTLAGMRTIKSLALESRQSDLWDRKTAAVARRQMELGHLSGMVQTVVRPLERLAVNGSYAFGIYLAIESRDPTYMGSLFMFLMLSQRVAGPLMQMAQLVHQGDEARAAVGMVAGLVNRPLEDVGAANGVRKPLEGAVEFSNLRFKYAGAMTYALDGVSFAVPKGYTLGIVGRSGSGKTTVTRLLQRLHSEYDGVIKIDDIDIRQYDLKHLRRSLGVVLQENFLFSGSIKENICAAKPHATFDEVVNACRLAGAEEFIERLPAGYDTYIYEGSPNLSGGQRQRLAIARALILDPRILILDEATSALDPDSEAIVNENIRRIAAGRTVIVISHRLSSLVASDAIMVLERGKFEAMGRHEELLETCEIYRGLWNQQNRHTDALLRRTSRGPARVS